jgi:DNA polymerase type B, organellar and viral
MTIKIQRINADDFDQLPSNPQRINHNRARDGHSTDNWEFLGVDGEGRDDANGIHRYIYLAGVTSDGTVYLDLHPKPGELYLRTNDVFKAFMTVPKRMKMIGYYFDYDVNKIVFDLLKQNGDDKYVRRLQKEGRVIWHNWRIVYIKKKQLIITRLVQNTEPGSYDPENSRCVWDTSGFFQGKFTETIKKWKVGTAGELAFVSKMKALRDNFDGVSLDEIEEYCRLECQLLSQTADKLRNQFKVLDIPVTRWDGAGAVAAGLLKKHRVEDYMHQIENRLPDEVIKSGYYGGRFDQSTFGECGEAYEYDINSAYPSQLMSIPCLSCNAWEYTQDFDGGTSRAIWHVSWDIPESAMWSPFPYRYPSGGIHWVRNGSGWYWNNEVQAALKLYPSSIRVTEGYVLSNRCNHKPFAFIKDYYDKRRQLKLANDLGHIVIKLGLNSLYGKTAQGRGHKDSAPRTQCLIWAGMITSDTRALLLNAIAEDPDDVLLIATDAVFKRSKSNILKDGTDLGEWEAIKLDDFFLVINGVYQAKYTDDDGILQIKNGTRGIDVQDFTPEVWASIRERSRTEEIFDFFVPVKEFIGMGKVISGQQPMSMWGQWNTYGRKNTFGKFKIKRIESNRKLYPLANKYDCDSALYEPDLYRIDEDAPVAFYRLLDDEMPEANNDFD